MSASEILRQFHGDIVAAQQHIWEELQKRTTWRLNFITYLTNNAYNNISEATVKEYYYKQYPEDAEKAFRAYLQKIEAEERKNNETGNISLKRSKSKKTTTSLVVKPAQKKEGYRRPCTK